MIPLCRNPFASISIVIALAALAATSAACAGKCELPEQVTGRLVDPTGQPVSGVTVEPDCEAMDDDADCPAVVTDEDGTFTLQAQRYQRAVDECAVEPLRLTLAGCETRYVTPRNAHPGVQGFQYACAD